MAAMRVSSIAPHQQPISTSEAMLRARPTRGRISRRREAARAARAAVLRPMADRSLLLAAAQTTAAERRKRSAGSQAWAACRRQVLPLLVAVVRPKGEQARPWSRLVALQKAVLRAAVLREVQPKAGLRPEAQLREVLQRAPLQRALGQRNGAAVARASTSAPPRPTAAVAITTAAAERAAPACANRPRSIRHRFRLPPL